MAVAAGGGLRARIGGVTRANQHLLIALLLPVLVFRALLPAGFMPATDGAGFRLVMCSEGMAAMTGHAHDGAHAAGHDHDSPPDDDSGRGDGPCLFALSALTVPPVEFLALRSEPLYLASFTAAPGSTLPPATGPPRQASVRGPPLSA